MNYNLLVVLILAVFLIAEMVLLYFYARGVCKEISLGKRDSLLKKAYQKKKTKHTSHRVLAVSGYVLIGLLVGFCAYSVGITLYDRYNSSPSGLPEIRNVTSGSMSYIYGYDYDPDTKTYVKWDYLKDYAGTCKVDSDHYCLGDDGNKKPFLFQGNDYLFALNSDGTRDFSTFNPNCDVRLAVGDVITTTALKTGDVPALYDIVLYKSASGEMIIHRITNIYEDSTGVLTFETHGDANLSNDRSINNNAPITLSQIYGIYTGAHIPYLGNVSSFLNSYYGWILILYLLIGCISWDYFMGVIYGAEKDRLKYLKDHNLLDTPEVATLLPTNPELAPLTADEAEGAPLYRVSPHPNGTINANDIRKVLYANGKTHYVLPDASYFDNTGRYHNFMHLFAVSPNIVMPDASVVSTKDYAKEDALKEQKPLNPPSPTDVPKIPASPVLEVADVSPDTPKIDDAIETTIPSTVVTHFDNTDVADLTNNVTVEDDGIYVPETPNENTAFLNKHRGKPLTREERIALKVSKESKRKQAKAERDAVKRYKYNK